MGREVNLDSILALDAEIIRLKRTRNSLLNITRTPPEILGHIFHFIIPEVGNPHFAGIPWGSYNFLLVCHHWFQVALRTPQLWSSWGNSLMAWKRWHLRSGISALDLILDEWRDRSGGLDEALRDALRDRAARNVIRKIHLKSNNREVLTAIISSLIPEGEDVRASNIESIVLSNVDVSDLFARHRFPKLRNLYLSDRLEISSWDHLESTTMVLTNLSLDFEYITPSSTVPTTSQIFALLTSNPNLRSLTLNAPPTDDDGGGGPRLPLRHLERVSLVGTFRSVFPILHRLEFPEGMDRGEFSIHNCTPQEVLEVVGPYIRDYLRRDGRFRDRLGIYVSSLRSTILFHASVVGVGEHGPSLLPEHVQDSPYGEFNVMLSRPIPHDIGGKLCTNVLTLLPQESIISFRTDLSVTEGVVAMPNLEALYLFRPVVSDGFLLPDPNGPNADKKLLPSLQQLYLEAAKVEDNNWDPLVTYLVHQTSGDQVISRVEVFGQGVHVCLKVLERMVGLVKHLCYEADPSKECPFAECPHEAY
jgi:hypothetical protein